MNEERNTESLVRLTGTITDSFSKLKFVTVACLACVFLTAIGAVAYSFHSVRQYTGKVYVVDRGQAYTASLGSATVVRADEIEHLSRYFHGLFFYVSPNMEVVERNVESAMRLCGDASVSKYFNDLKEQQFYAGMQSAQAVQEIVVDSVRVNTAVYPYEVVTYSTLYSTRRTSMVRSELVTRCNMINVTRDSANPNGLKIENFTVPRNAVVEKRRRNN